MPALAKRPAVLRPTADYLARCIDHINRLNPQPDAVLVTGDITDTGQAAEATQAADLLNQLRQPYFIVPGNHDDRASLASVFEPPMVPDTVGDYLCYVIDIKELRLIAMDSSRDNAPGGELCTTRLDWLDRQLGEDTQRPVIIFMHHPPLKCGITETDVDGFIGAQHLGTILGKYTHIERVVCGHIHRLVHARWHGTVISTAPSTGMELVLDLTQQESSQFVLQTPGYQLHYWTPDKILITHTVAINNVSGPYKFEGLTHR